MRMIEIAGLQLAINSGAGASAYRQQRASSGWDEDENAKQEAETNGKLRFGCPG